MNINKKVSLLGYGWLGKPLAKALQALGYTVKASTTTSEKLDLIEAEGLQSYLLALDPELTVSNMDFFDSDVLIVNFPPKRRADIVDYHTKQIEALLNAVRLSTIKQVIFISSTSVYPSTNKVMLENNVEPADKPSGVALQIAEKLLQNERQIQSTIIRFAGLIGNDRVPGRFLSGKTNLKNGFAPVNLIHQDDCVNIILEILRQDVWGEVFNACMKEHPLRKEYYIKAAQKANLPEPVFVDSESKSYKIIDSSKLERVLSYSFKYTNPLDIL